MRGAAREWVFRGGQGDHAGVRAQSEFFWRDRVLIEKPRPFRESAEVAARRREETSKGGPPSGRSIFSIGARWGPW
jgi:hypothetical protein